MNLGAAFTGAGQGADAFMNGGIADYERLHQLQLQQQQERANNAAKSDFVNYLQSLNAPPPVTPSVPAAPGQPSVPMVRPGAPPSGAAAPPMARPAAPPPAAPAPTLGQPITVAGVLQSIKATNPKASPDEVLAALQMAAPYMDSQEKAKIDALKNQLDVYKAQNQAQAQQNLEKTRAATLQLNQQRVAEQKRRDDAWIKSLQTRGMTKADATKIVTYNSRLTELKTAAQQIVSKYAGPPPPTSPDAATYAKLQKLILQGQSEITYMRGQMANMNLPPPPDSGNFMQLPSDNTSEDTGTGGG